MNDPLRYERHLFNQKSAHSSDCGNEVADFAQDIQLLIKKAKAVTVNAEIKVYVQNIVTFLRLHRAVASGITSRATHHFDLLIK